MIGIGKWQVSVNMLIFRGDIDIVIEDRDGEYNIDFIFPDKLKGFKIDIYEVNENGNTLSGKGKVDMGKGKFGEVGATATFEGDTLTGVLSIPMLKREIPLKNGHRIG